MSGRLLNLAVPLALALTLTIIGLSAYLRLHEGGAGCTPWPACYARLAGAANTPEDINAVVQTIHRALAGVLILTAALILAAVYSGGHGPDCKRTAWLIVGLLVVLSVVGPLTPQKQFPVFATLNVLCAMVLLAAIARLGWRHIHLPRDSAPPVIVRRTARAGVGLLLLAIAGGGWSSASFAPLADTSKTPAAEQTALHVFAPWRELAINPRDGRVEPGAGHGLLRPAHRLVSLLAVVALGAPALVRWRNRRPSGRSARAVLIAMAAGALSGLWASTTPVPLAAVLMHNLAAAALLLAAVTFDYQLSGQPHETT